MSQPARTIGELQQQYLKAVQKRFKATYPDGRLPTAEAMKALCIKAAEDLLPPAFVGTIILDVDGVEVVVEGSPDAPGLQVMSIEQWRQRGPIY